ncbi:MAG: DNA-3-methyladenine glycosylase I, partial [Acinetobacter sp.]|nr:DNA-3-methyladenine glycosylase I [Acinetobacter sp.]
ITDIAAFTDDQLEYKLSDAGLIRHLGKLKAIRDNAIAWQQLKNEVGDVSHWLWSFVDHQTPNHDVIHYRDAPAQTDISQNLSKILKKRGFKFVGPTTCYAFMQAVGMVNDHENHCHFK